MVIVGWGVVNVVTIEVAAVVVEGAIAAVEVVVSIGYTYNFV